MITWIWIAIKSSQSRSPMVFFAYWKLTPLALGLLFVRSKIDWKQVPHGQTKTSRDTLYGGEITSHQQVVERNSLRYGINSKFKIFAWYGDEGCRSALQNFARGVVTNSAQFCACRHYTQWNVIIRIGDFYVLTLKWLKSLDANAIALA